MSKFIINVKWIEGVNASGSLHYDKKGFTSSEFKINPFTSEEKAIEYYNTVLKPYYYQEELKRLRYFVTYVRIQKLNEQTGIFEDYKTIYTRAYPFIVGKAEISYITNEPIITDNRELQTMARKTHCRIDGGYRKDDRWVAFITGIKNDIDDLCDLVWENKETFKIESRP